MAIYCNKCGAELITRDNRQWDCPDCDNYLYIANDGNEYWRSYFEPEDYDEVYSDDFCKTCDSDSYPMCRGGCPYIDE